MDGSNVLGEYLYNGNGQRADKLISSQNKCTVFHYDQNGLLITESTRTGNIKAEYVYLNGQPLAKIENNNVYYYHNDHLGTPTLMMDSSGSTVWQGEYLPFGEPLSVSGTITNNLRFPGQYYDAETELNQNGYRDYYDKLGRYVEADPIGLKGGINRYSYTANNPVNAIDVFGLICKQITPWERVKIFSDPNDKGILIDRYSRKKWNKTSEWNTLPIPDNKGRVAKIFCCCKWELVGYEVVSAYLKDILYEATFECCDGGSSKKCNENPCRREIRYKTFSSTYQEVENEPSLFNPATAITCGCYTGGGKCACNSP